MNRSHESPMEFEWDNQHGPADPSSPFANFKQNEAGRKRHLGSPHVSPKKNIPKFGTPSSTPYLFNTPIKPTNPSALNTRQNYQTPAFQTPRKFDTPGTDIFSSGAEDSPATGEQETPDMGTTEKERGRKSKQEPQPVKRKGSILGNLFGLNDKKKTTATSKEIVLSKGRNRSSSGKPYSEAAAKKVHKRRQRMGSENERFAGEENSGGDESLDEKYNSSGGGKSGNAGMGGRTRPSQQQSQRSQSWHSGAYGGPDAASSWVQTHRDIPSIVSQYLQLGINISIGCLALYLIFGVVSALQHDINDSVTKAMQRVDLERSMCLQEWEDNHCSKRAPFLVEKCREWEACFNRDPGLVGRATVTMETFAQIINSFVEEISYKSMIFCFLMVFGVIFSTNFAFGFFRAKQVHHPNPFLAAAVPPLASHMPVTWEDAYHHQAFATPSKTPGYISYRTPYKTPSAHYSFDDINENMKNAYDENENVSPVPEKKRLLNWQQ